MSTIYSFNQCDLIISVNKRSLKRGFEVVIKDQQTKKVSKRSFSSKQAILEAYDVDDFGSEF